MHAERYPLSGASRFRNSGHDIDIYALGRKECPLVAECKGRKNGGGVNGVYRRLENARQAERIRSEGPPLRAMSHRCVPRPRGATTAFKGALREAPLLFPMV